MEISGNVIIAKKMQKKAPDILNFLLELHDASFDAEDFADLKQTNRKLIGHNCFFVTTTTRDHHLMYILSGSELLRRNLDVDRVRILGIAASAQEAREIVRMIMEDVAAERALTQIKDYLEKY